MKYSLEVATRELMSEMIPLFDIHYKQIAHYQDIPLNPDYDRYLMMQDAGMLRVFTARSEDDSLVGYSVFFINHNIHYKDSLQAVQDILFIHPNHRGAGGRLIKWCDEALAEEGVQAVYHHVKAAHNFGPLLERMGYELVDYIYARRLD